MNIKEYISSGIIETYVMGLASETERQEFEANCAQYPEIAEARNAFELVLEEQLQKDSGAVPLFLKNQILEKITSESEISTGHPEEERAPVRSIGVWRWLTAASIILLAGSVFWALTINKKYQQIQARDILLRDSIQKINEEVAAIKEGNAGKPKSDFMMASITAGNQSSVSIYWDTVSKDVYMMIKNMPQPPSDKQYQLWALLPDETASPVDLGMIEIKQERLLYRMKNVHNAKAFAITLEPKGGSPAPTGEPMVSTPPVNL